MAVEKWSDRVTVARLADDPQMTEDLLALDQSANHLPRDIVIDFTGVRYINSSHLARLIDLRKKTVTHDGRLLLCGMCDQVWGAFLVTGMDKVFRFTDDVATALASLEIRR